MPAPPTSICLYYNYRAQNVVLYRAGQLYIYNVVLLNSVGPVLQSGPIQYNMSWHSTYLKWHKSGHCGMLMILSCQSHACTYCAPYMYVKYKVQIGTTDCVVQNSDQSFVRQSSKWLHILGLHQKVHRRWIRDQSLDCQGCKIFNYIIIFSKVTSVH